MRPFEIRVATAVVGVLAGAALAAPAVDIATGGAAASGPAGPIRPVRVLYAGSLVEVMEYHLAPAFTRETGIAVLGRPGGSTALAHLIRDGLEPADVFLSADPAVNEILAPDVRWFVVTGSTTMVIAYLPAGRLAPLLRRAVDPGPRAEPRQAGTAPAAANPHAWFRVLATPGLRLGRTDPALDPKGYRTIFVLRLAERYYGEPGLAARVIGDPENPAQIFPEEALVGRLTSGQIDAGFFYLIEAIGQGLPAVALPAAVNLGDPARAREYAEVTYTDARGAVHRGAPILYTVAIPSSARNAAGAVRFVAFLLSRPGRALLAARGVVPVPALAGGDPAAVPAPLRPFIAGRYRQ